MGLLDSLRAALGLQAEADATSDADPEDLFALSTGYVTMATELEFEPVGSGALCFSAVDSTDFADAVRDVEDVLAAGAVETGTEATLREDSHGYDWVVFEDPEFEDLVTSVHFAADTLAERGYGSRLLAALFAFEREDTTAYWVYSFRRGAYYPFAPQRDRERDTTVEFKLRSVLADEIDIEDDEQYWYPLWPERPAVHPWE